MKAKIFIIVFSVLFMSCPQDDDFYNAETQVQTIEGSWNLKLVYGGLMPINIDYNLGDVKWTFNEDIGNVVIENNVISTGPEDIHAGLDSGTYSYEILLINNEQKLYIDNSEIGIITIEDDNLDVDNGLAADGFVSKYER